MRVQPTRPAELAEQPEASLAPAGVTPRVKRRQRAHGPRDRVPKSCPSLGADTLPWVEGRAPVAAIGLTTRGPPGSKTGARAQGLPRNLGDPVSSVDTHGAGIAGPIPCPPTRPAAPRTGENERQGDGTSEQGNERGGTGGRESERCIVPRKLGNRPIGTQRRESGAVNCNHWRERWPELRLRAPSQRNNSG